MAQVSKIQWTDATWNIARGCTKVDDDCKFCYMYRDSMAGTRYDPRDIVRTKTVFNLPFKIKEPSKIFTCSLTDFFHQAIDGYRNEAWDIIRQCPQHTFQILTKRPERVRNHLPPDWGKGWENVWLGTSIGSPSGLHRYYDLVKLRDIARTLFLSVEPLHERIKEFGYFDMSEIIAIDWVTRAIQRIIPTKQYFVAQCEKCGFKETSEYWKGGGQIADTGDYGDVYCPVCGQVDCEEAGDDKWQDNVPILLKRIDELNIAISDLEFEKYQSASLSLRLLKWIERENIGRNAYRYWRYDNRNSVQIMTDAELIAAFIEYEKQNPDWDKP